MEQIKDLWWTPGELAFDYLVIVLPLVGQDCHGAWLIPANVVKSKLGGGCGDITLSGKLPRESWADYHEHWELQ